MKVRGLAVTVREGCLVVVVGTNSRPSESMSLASGLALWIPVQAVSPKAMPAQEFPSAFEISLAVTDGRELGFETNNLLMIQDFTRSGSQPSPRAAGPPGSVPSLLLSPPSCQNRPATRRGLGGSRICVPYPFPLGRKVTSLSLFHMV